jgi:hypothetical protein
MTPKLSDELRHALKQQSGQPLHVEDPETHTQYVLIRLDVYRQMRKVAQGPQEATVQKVEEQLSGNASALPDWCNVYDGLSDDEIAAAEQVILQRADLTRPS